MNIKYLSSIVGVMIGLGASLGTSQYLGQLLNPSVLIVNDSDAGFSVQDGVYPWQQANNQGYRSNVHYAAPGDGSAVAWWGVSLPAGTTEIFATWSPFENRASNATYIGTSFEYVANQKNAPSGLEYNGASWEKIGEVTLVARGSMKVRLNNDADGFVIADALLFRRRTENPPPVCGNGIIDEGEQCDEGADDNGECDNQCQFCPIPDCAAPPQGCHYEQTGELGPNGCFAEACGTLVCESSCTETDEGKDYAKKGWLTLVLPEGTETRNDNCVRITGEDAGNLTYESVSECFGYDCFLYELSCNEDNSFEETYEFCQSGCREGTCVSGSVCGDGIRDSEEDCDDGNTTYGDGCSAVCTKEEEKECYGSDQCNPGEKCTTEMGDCRPPSYCNLDEPCPDVCAGICVQNRCGDGITDEGEECDDANIDLGDGCDAECRRESPENLCGNGIMNDGEECEFENECEVGSCTYATCTCSLELESSLCGNGIQGEPGEECDDGNTRNGDGCSSTCKWTCDEGDNGNDPYNAAETYARDGAGMDGCIDMMHLSEQYCEEDLDIGNEIHTCANGCSEGVCLGGSTSISYKSARWTCSNGADRMLDGACLSREAWEMIAKIHCSPGTISSFQIGAACDVGGVSGDDAGAGEAGGFDSNGGMYPECGNGVTEPENNEACDDGNNEDGDGCNALCQPE